MQKSLRNIETAKCEARFSETPLYIFNSFAIFVCWWGLADRKLKDFLGITTVLLQMPPVFWKSRVKEDERYSWQSKIIFPKSLPILISWVYINFQSKSFKVQNNYYYIEKEKKTLIYVCEHHCSVWVGALQGGKSVWTACGWGSHVTISLFHNPVTSTLDCEEWIYPRSWLSFMHLSGFSLILSYYSTSHKHDVCNSVECGCVSWSWKQFIL